MALSNVVPNDVYGFVKKEADIFLPAWNMKNNVIIKLNTGAERGT